jgi:hypothetical protein
LFSKKPAVGIASIEKEVIGVYPNPASKSLTINTTKDIQSVVIYNALGQVVLTTSPNTNDVNIDIDSLPNGFYTVKATINGVDTFKKIIKE